MTTLQLTTLTSEQRDAFIRGWQNAGGYMDDADSPSPWCAPWTSCDAIDVEGETVGELLVAAATMIGIFLWFALLF